MDAMQCLSGILLIFTSVLIPIHLIFSLKKNLIRRVETNATCMKCDSQSSDLYNVAMEYYVDGRQIISEKILVNVEVPMFLKAGREAMVYVNPERPREFLFSPKRDMTGIITGLLLGIIGLSMILPTGLTLVKTGLGA
ncbi:MAG: hypothetical protein VZR00_08785 [Lachnospiraceae bacterium]|nr:hypothetical protein [Oribacterium sp.]MDY6317873.1 hypothetical protein [Oribacterium sp.]MEE3461963.1 hypothetical protein [Lachnospiraceae bacterium]